MNVDETKDQTQDGRVKKTDDSYTRIMQLVRGLSNQDEDIDGKPKISYALKTLHRTLQQRGSQIISIPLLRSRVDFGLKDSLLLGQITDLLTAG